MLKITESFFAAVLEADDNNIVNNSGSDISRLNKLNGSNKLKNQPNPKISKSSNPKNRNLVKLSNSKATKKFKFLILKLKRSLIT